MLASSSRETCFAGRKRSSLAPASSGPAANRADSCASRLSSVQCAYHPVHGNKGRSESPFHAVRDRTQLGRLLPSACLLRAQRRDAGPTNRRGDEFARELLNGHQAIPSRELVHWSSSWRTPEDQTCRPAPSIP